MLTIVTFATFVTVLAIAGISYMFMTSAANSKALAISRREYRLSEYTKQLAREQELFGNGR
jgi:hypothetical protein